MNMTPFDNAHGARDPAHDRLDFDHLNFAEAIDLEKTFKAALLAIAVDGSHDDLDKMALLYGRVLARRYEAFREFERERDVEARKLQLKEEEAARLAAEKDKADETGSGWPTCDNCGSTNISTDETGLIDTCNKCGAERA
jgi:hypothetical protein